METTLNKVKTAENLLEERLCELEKFCFDNKFPMLVCVATDAEHYNSHMVSAAMVDKKLKDDKIANMVCILRGFVAVPPTEPMTLEYEA